MSHGAHTDSGLASDAPAPLAPSPRSARMVLIVRCRDCPKLKIEGNAHCLPMGRKLADVWDIPEWCPMPVAPNDRRCESALAELVAATTAYDYAQSAKAKRAAGARVVQARNAARAMLSPNDPAHRPGANTPTT